MLPPCFFPTARPFALRRGSALLCCLLLAFSPAARCSAAEVTLGQDCSLQLPAGWTAKKAAVKENDGVEGTGPRGAEFFAGTFDTRKAIEEVEVAQAFGFETNRGYKQIEKGSVKNRNGVQAQLTRFELDGRRGPAMGIGYTFRDSEKRVGALLFVVPSDAAKSYRSDIEAIFNSVKVGERAAKDESWLSEDTDSGTRAPAPATGSTGAKEGGARAAAERGGRMTFGENGSIQVPAGWTAKLDRTILRGHGPRGMTFTAMSVASARSSKSTDDFIRAFLGNFEKKPGYKLLDMDSDPRKGKFAHYVYNHEGAALGVMTFFIEKETQIVVLSVAMPGTEDADAKTAYEALDAISSSLEVRE